MKWDATMSVNIPELDSQHQMLITLINNAYEAIQQHDEYLLPNLIDQMRKYAMIHFEFEENLLEKHGYPDLASHKVLHEKFNDQVTEFQHDLFEKTNFSQIFLFLSRWLTNHIMKEDKKYIKYMPKEELQEDS